MNAIQKLRQLCDEINDPAGDPVKKLAAWGTVSRLVGRMPTDQDEASRVVAQQDGAGLEAIVRAIESPGEAAPGASAADDAALASVSKGDMDAAMKAFKKRLKLARLADESRLGGRYTSGGRSSKIDAILPPDEFEEAVWKALVREGRLTYTGKGFYAEA